MPSCLAPPAVPPGHSLRRRRLQPLPSLSELDVFDAVEILDEIPGQLGLVLWHSLRDLGRWARAAPDAREGLFQPDAYSVRIATLESLEERDLEVAEPLRTLAVLLAQPATIHMDLPRVAAERLSRWAWARNATATAMAFARAMVRTDALSADAALWMGELALHRAETARAEVWLREAILLARHRREPRVHVRAYLLLGRTYARAQDSAVAERCCRRAARVAARSGLADLEAESMHALARICASTGRGPEAVTSARRALELYPDGHPGIPRLGYEIALLWLEERRLSLALPLLDGVWSALDSHDRERALAGVLRTSGAMHDRGTFERFWTMAAEAETGWTEPGLLLDIARGALSLGEHGRARRVAERASRLSRASRDADSERAATTLLRVIPAGGSQWDAATQASLAAAPVGFR